MSARDHSLRSLPPQFGEEPSLLAPGEPVVTFAAAQRAMEGARRSAQRALRARQFTLRCMIAAGVIPGGVVFFLAGTQDPTRMVGETYYGVISAAVVFGAGAAVVGGLCVACSVLEDRALTGLETAARRLTAEQAVKLAGELRTVAAEQHREVLNVILKQLDDQPSEVLPAAAPAGGTRELAAFEVTG